MTIHLLAELERLILDDVKRGPYRTVDEFLEQAVRLLHEQEDWLATHRAAIAGLVEAGWTPQLAESCARTQKFGQRWRIESALG